MTNTLDLIILAVTKLGNEVCVAGVDENGQWIRPTVEVGQWRQFYKSDIFDSNNQPVIASSNVVRISLIRNIPDRPHIEDWEYDRRQKAVLIKTLNDDQRLHLFNKISAKSLNPLTINHEKSLCLIEPTSVKSFDFANKSFKGKYQPKIRFIFDNNEYNLPAADVYCRAFGRHFLSQNKPYLTEDDFKRKFNKIFFTIGLSRWHEETQTYHPMIIGVHLVPNFSAGIDYNEL